MENQERKICSVCKKKLSRIPLKCKCDFYFCTKHFFFTNHNCSYNFKKEYDSNGIMINLQKSKVQKL